MSPTNPGYDYENSTAAAILSCMDVDNGNGVSHATCGFRWTAGGDDGNMGAGQQMNVPLERPDELVDRRGAAEG